MPWPPAAEATDDDLKNLNLSVDYYAIDIGDAGDCGIYYLIEHPPSGTPNALPFIHRAVLIDGGFKVGAARIRDFLSRFQKHNPDRTTTPDFYSFDTTQGGRQNLKYPPFDSIVITHWDEDHYQGVIKLIHDEAVGVLSRDRDNYLCSYMKYKPKTGSATSDARQDRAYTRIYAPYWGTPNISSKVKMKFPTIAKSGKKKKVKSDWEARPFKPNGFSEDSIPLYIDPDEFLDWRVDVSTYLPKLCKIGTGLKYLLGLNLFTNRRLIPPSGSTNNTGLAEALAMPNPQALAIYHKDGSIPASPPSPSIAPSAAWPVLTIVAGMSKDDGDTQWVNKCCGDKITGRRPDTEILALGNHAITTAELTGGREPEGRELQEKEIWNHLNPASLSRSHVSRIAQDAQKGRLSMPSSKTGSLPSAPVAVKIHPPVKIVNKRLSIKDSEYTNAASLVTMVIWTTGQLSCYAGGDANWENELRVVAWIKNGTNPYKSVRTVKLSHHGSGYSTPTELIRNFNPRNIVVMANPQNSFGLTHFHPRAEVLLWLYLWLAATSESRIVISPSNSIRNTGLVKATTFPYYLTWEGGNYKFKLGKRTLGAFRDGSSTSTAVKAYQTSAGVLITHLEGKGAVNPDFLATFRSTPAADRPKYIAQIVGEKWKLLSDVNYDSAAVGASAFNPATMTPVSSDKRILHIWTACRPVDGDRRQVADGVIDGHGLAVTREMLDNADMAKDLFATQSTKGAAKNTKSRVPGGIRVQKLALEQKELILSTKRVGTLAAAKLAKDLGSSSTDGSSSSSGGDVGSVVVPKGRGKGAKKGGGGKKPIKASVPARPGPTLKLGGPASTPVSPKATLPATDFWLTPDFVASQIPSSIGLVLFQLASGADPGSPFDPWTGFIPRLDIPALHVLPSGSLAPDDLLRNWLSLTTLVPPETAGVDMVVDISGTQTSAILNSLTLKLPPTPANPAMSFSSGTILGNFPGAGQQPALPVGFTGYVPFYNFIILGLAPDSKGDKSQPDPAKSWTLSQVFHQVNVDPGGGDSKAVVLDALLLVFQKAFDLNLYLQKGMIWFASDENRLTIQRLEFSLEDSAEKSLTTWFDEWLHWDIKITNIRFVIRRETILITSEDDPSSSSNPARNFEYQQKHELLVMFQLTRTKDGGPSKAPIITCGLDLSLDSGSTSLIVTLKIDPSSSTASSNIVSFLSWLLPSATAEFKAVESIIPVIDKIALRSVGVTITKSNGTIDISRIVVNAEYSDPTWTVQDDDGSMKAVPLLLTYSWTKGRPQPHAARLIVWLEPDVMSWLPPQIMPRYEDLYHIRPSSPAPASIRLDSLLRNSRFQLPKELDLEIVDLVLDLADKTVSFTGKLQRDPDQADHSSIGISLDEVSLTASYTWASSSSSSPDPASYSIELYVDFDVGPNPNSTINTDDDDDEEEDENGYISCDLSFVAHGNDRVFQLLGTIGNVTLAQLARFFPDGDSDIVQSLLGHITILGLTIAYNYDPTGVASDFAVVATLILGPLELGLDFTRDHNDWNFDAGLKAASPTAVLTIETILDEAMGPNSSLVGDIPPFVKDINLAGAAISLSISSHKPPQQDPSSGNPPSGDAADNGSLVICLSLEIPGFEDSKLGLAFYQITERPATGAKADLSTTKRLFKVTLDGLPWNKIPKIPVIDSMKPPFDELGFYWVSDPTWKDPTKQPGLTWKEVDKLNQLSPVPYKPKSASSGNQPPDAKAQQAIVLEAGWHFFVLDSGGQGESQVKLDYLFKKPSLPTPKKLASSSADSGQSAGDDNADKSTGTSKGTLNKTIGPFTVENVGIRYQDDHLTVFLDILAHLGPIGMDLLGFGITVDLSSGSLKDIVTQIPTFSLQGMGVEFNVDAVAIAGLFVEKTIGSSKIYAGGITLTIEPYSFLAVGAYGETNPSDGSSYKTVFFFAKLDGPLIELEFVTISGICLGFGFNSRLRFPSVQEVPSYPLIANSELGGDDPLAIMDKLANPATGNAIITPQNTCYWLAAGLEGKLLQVLDVTAVVVVEFNPYVSLGIFAKAIGEMPTGNPFIYMELGVAATVDFHSGTMRTEAQLTPNSFIINPSCHLTGGFGLCTWFYPSEHAGDFVFTVGGYHNAYKPPGHYPNPPRLGISWILSSNLRITGEAYFAITPKACMAGGKLQANFDAGLLHAWLTAWADALIEYHPFSLLVNIGLDVGVSFTLELLFVSIDISVTIGAQLTLWAVPFGGNVYVDFWVFGFSIGFGSGNSQGEPKTIEQLRDLLIQIPDTDAPSATASPTVDKLHIISVEKGFYADNVKDPEFKQSELWDVKRSGFVFRVQSRVPIRSITETTSSDSATLDKDFFARPMQDSNPLHSSMTVTVTKDDGAPEPFTLVSKVLKQSPIAIWGKPVDPHNDDRLDPASAGTTKLLTGASFRAPPPQISNDILVPIDVLKSLALDVFTDKDRPNDGKHDEHPALPADVTMQSAAWNGVQPAAGPAQWDNVAASWAHPDISVPIVEDEVSQSAVDVTAGVWSECFGWDMKLDPVTSADVTVNQLRDHLKGTGDDEPLVWKHFDELYMAAPLIGVAA